MPTGTDVTLTCDVSEISVTSTVVWKDSDGTDVTTLASNVSYTVVSGSYNSSGEEQSFKLEISGDANDEDTTYTCEITPSGGTPQPTTLTVDVFGKYLVYY